LARFGQININKFRFAGKQMPIMPLESNYLTPTMCLNKNVTLEGNFGAKPFKYNIDECPGMLFE
jgi:hypothetical protein